MLVYPNWNDVVKLGNEIRENPDRYNKIVFYPTTRHKYIHYLKDINPKLVIEHADIIGTFINPKLWNMRYPKMYINLINNDFMDLLTLRNILVNFGIGKNIKAYGNYAKRLEFYLKEDHHKLTNKNTIIIDRQYCLSNLLNDPTTYYGNFLEMVNKDEFSKLKTNTLLEILKDKNIYEASVILNEYTKCFKSMKDDPNVKNMLVQYVQMVKLKDELAFHINTLEKIVEKKKNPLKDFDNDSDFIDVIREYCKNNMNEEYKQKITKVFGYQHMFTFVNLKKAGFMNMENNIKFKIKKGSDLIFIGGCTYDELKYFYDQGVNKIFTTDIIDCREFLKMVIDA